VRASAGSGVALVPLTGGGDPGDEAWWRAALASPDPARRAFGGVTLATTDTPSINLRYNVELGRPRSLARLRVDFPAGWSSRGRDLAAWLAPVAAAYAAHSGGVHTNDLLEVVRGARIEPPAGLPASVPAEVRAIFAELEPVAALDVLAVPEAVWWINWWPRALVETIGSERVAAAPWSHVVEHASARMVMTTVDAPDRDHLPAVERVARLTKATELAVAQRAWRHRNRTGP
jgi:hypothetical protein